MANIKPESIREKLEFKDVLATLQKRWPVIDFLHWVIDSELCKPHIECKPAFTNYEKQFVNVKKDGRYRIDKNQHCNYKYLHTSWNYQQRTTFKDLVMETIRLNPLFSCAQKIQLKN